MALIKYKGNIVTGHVMKVCGVCSCGSIFFFLTFTEGVGEWSMPCPGHFTPDERAHVAS